MKNLSSKPVVFLPTADGKGTLMIYYGSKQEGVSDHYYGGQQVRQLYVLNLETLETQKLTNNLSSI